MSIDVNEEHTDNPKSQPYSISDLLSKTDTKTKGSSIWSNKPDDPKSIREMPPRIRGKQQRHTEIETRPGRNKYNAK